MQVDFDADVVASIAIGAHSSTPQCHDCLEKAFDAAVLAKGISSLWGFQRAALQLQVGGTPAVLKYLLKHNLIDGSCLTVTGKKICSLPACIDHSGSHSHHLWLQPHRCTHPAAPFVLSVKVGQVSQTVLMHGR